MGIFFIPIKHIVLMFISVTNYILKQTDLQFGFTWCGSTNESDSSLPQIFCPWIKVLSLLSSPFWMQYLFLPLSWRALGSTSFDICFSIFFFVAFFTFLFSLLIVVHIYTSLILCSTSWLFLSLSSFASCCSCHSQHHYCYFCYCRCPRGLSPRGGPWHP